jgi:uncharacterized membrane protein YhfC
MKPTVIQISTVLAIAFIIELVLVFGFPLALGVWLRRRFRVSWLFFVAGGITFGLSQAIHLPLNQAVLALAGGPEPQAAALVLGLTAGLCEETARYVAYRWVLTDLREWRQALMFGAGHGGIESIVFVGLLVGAVLLNMTVLHGMTLEAWGLPPGQAAQLQGKLEDYWGQEWTMPLLAAVERLFSITFHVGMAVLALQAVAQKKPSYWILAIALHTSANALAVTTAEADWDLIATEGVIGLFALLALGVMLVFRPDTDEQTQSSAPDLPPLPVTPQQPPTPEERLRRQIEESKYER